MCEGRISLKKKLSVISKQYQQYLLAGMECFLPNLSLPSNRFKTFFQFAQTKKLFLCWGVFEVCSSYMGQLMILFRIYAFNLIWMISFIVTKLKQARPVLLKVCKLTSESRYVSMKLRRTQLSYCWCITRLLQQPSPDFSWCHFGLLLFWCALNGHAISYC